MMSSKYYVNVVYGYLHVGLYRHNDLITLAVNIRRYDVALLLLSYSVRRIQAKMRSSSKQTLPIVFSGRHAGLLQNLT